MAEPERPAADTGAELYGDMGAGGISGDVSTIRDGGRGEIEDVGKPPGEERGARPGLVEGEREGAGGRGEPVTQDYSKEFTDKLNAAREAASKSRSFTEYVPRARTRSDYVVHTQPTSVMEAKSLAGIKGPDLEDAYMPSHSVMKGMEHRRLSLEGNIEPAWAAIQQNDKYGAGMLIADDVCLEKSRTGAAWAIDRIEKNGRKRILIITDNQHKVPNLINAKFPGVGK